jgi:hypothetical protein
VGDVPLSRRLAVRARHGDNARGHLPELLS